MASDPRIAMILNKLEELEPLVGAMGDDMAAAKNSLAKVKTEVNRQLMRLSEVESVVQDSGQLYNDRLNDLEAKVPKESGIEEKIAAVSEDVKRLDNRCSKNHENVVDSLGNLRLLIDHMNSHFQKEIDDVEQQSLSMLHDQDARIDAYKPVIVELQMLAAKYEEKLIGVNSNVERMVQSLSNRLKEFADGFPEVRRLAEECDKKVSICEKMCDAMQNKLRNYESRLLKIEKRGDQ